jgi:two-component system, sensor histidine kinase and response regulator
VTANAQTPDKATIRFAIRDTGIGIPKALQARLFSPFSQADASTTRKYGGTGLGLTISAKLAEGMEGKIDIESASGEGSIFYLTAVFGLPTAAAAQQIPRISPLAGLSALVVDDNATNRAALVDTMRSWGMIADAVHGGDEALAALRQRSAGTQPFDVILVDAQMPSMDGATLARTIGLDPDLAKTSLIMMGAAKKSGRLNGPGKGWLRSLVEQTDQAVPPSRDALCLARVRAADPSGAA